MREWRVGEALEVIKARILNGTSNSEIYRLKGQIELELERIDEAIDSLIQSLKLNSQNEYALILIGNIYLNHNDDVETALSYHEKVLDLNEVSYLSLNNIGSKLAKQGKLIEASSYFKKTLEIKPTYPHALYGLALAKKELKEPLEGFDFEISAVKESSQIKHRTFVPSTKTG